MNSPKGFDESQNNEQSPEQAEWLQRVVTLNDSLRQTGQGGRVVATQGIQALPQNQQIQMLDQIRAFSGFTPDNDPYGEHDFGSVEVQGEKVFWKIDYYDQSYTMHSPDKADPNVTNRVMTIMLASEY